MMTMQGSPQPLFRKGSHASTCNEGKGTECSRKACTGPCFLPPKRGGHHTLAACQCWRKIAAAHTPRHTGQGQALKGTKAHVSIHSGTASHSDTSAYHPCKSTQRNATYYTLRVVVGILHGGGASTTVYRSRLGPRRGTAHEKVLAARSKALKARTKAPWPTTAKKLLEHKHASKTRTWQSSTCKTPYSQTPAPPSPGSRACKVRPVVARGTGTSM